MNSTAKRGKKAFQRNNLRATDTRVNYTKALLHRSVPIPIVNVGSNLVQTLERAIAVSIEGKCIADGYVKPDTTKLGRIQW